MAEQGAQISRVSVASTRQRKNNDQGQERERSCFSQSCSGLNASIADPSQRDRDEKPQDKMRKIDRIASQSIEFVGIEKWEQISCDSSGSKSFERTGQEVA